MNKKLVVTQANEERHEVNGEEWISWENQDKESGRSCSLVPQQQRTFRIKLKDYYNNQDMEPGSQLLQRQYTKYFNLDIITVIRIPKKNDLRNLLHKRRGGNSSTILSFAYFFEMNNPFLVALNRDLKIKWKVVCWSCFCRNVK